MEDLELEGKTVFLRVDINTPINPATGEIIDLSRIDEACITIQDLDHCKLVIGSHQGRVGREDYVSLSQHRQAIEKKLGRPIKFVGDVFGPAAVNEIRSLSKGDVLLLDNLRFAAEENMEFTPEQGSKTIMVQRLVKHLDGCILDAFSTAHRAHPSIVGFSHLLQTCGGRVIIRELKALNRIMVVAKPPFVTVLGGAKVSDRLEAINTLIENGKADKVLLSGVVGSLFLRASGKAPGIQLSAQDQKMGDRARSLLKDYPNSFELPLDVAVERDEHREEIPVEKLKDHKGPVLDIGSASVDHYSRMIRSAGSVFMSGPAGLFERPDFSYGTNKLLKAVATSAGTTIVSGGHLTAAIERLGIRNQIDHVSTAGGALVLFMAGKKLPLLEALEAAAERLGK